LNDDADIPTNVPESVAPNEALPLTSVKEKTAEEFSPRHLALFTLKTQEINRLTDATTNKVFIDLFLSSLYVCMAIKYNCFCLWKHHVNVLLMQ
jgi:hypothetical protein